MSVWTHISGMLVFQVALSERNSIRFYKGAKQVLERYFGKYSTMYNGVPLSYVISFPKGTNTSVTYRVLDLTDYDRNKYMRTTKGGSRGLRGGGSPTGRFA